MPTIGLIVITGALGATLARQQGLSTLAKIQSELKSGRPPAQEMVEGALIVVGGLVLLTPGILTDLFGFAMMVPKIRKSFAEKLKKSFGSSFIRTSASGFHAQGSNFKKQDDDVIDV